MIDYLKRNYNLSLIIRLFYLLKLLIISVNTYDLFTLRNLTTAQWLMPVSFLSWFSNPAIPIVVLVSVLFIFCLLAIKFPFRVPIKIIELILFYFFFAAYYSFGKINHNLYAVLMSSIFISLLDLKHQERNAFFFKSAIAITLLSYTLAGIWKLRFLYNAIVHFGIDSHVKVIAAHHVAINSISTQLTSDFSNWFLKLPGNILFFIWIMLIIFETLSLFIVFKTKLYRPWAVLIILFHVVSHYLMNILLWENMLLVFIFMIMTNKSILNFRDAPVVSEN